MKKNSFKNIAKLIAKEFNINSDLNNIESKAKLIDIGIERIEEIKNEFLYNELSKTKKSLKIDFEKIQPFAEKALEDKPVFDTLKRIWDMKNEDSSGIDIQDIALEFENDFKKSRVKQITKPSKKSKKIEKRNNKIRSEYYKLRNENSNTQKVALAKLATKYSLAMSTILTITKK